MAWGQRVLDSSYGRPLHCGFIHSSLVCGLLVSHRLLRGLFRGYNTPTTLGLTVVTPGSYLGS
jgi:hypothetical protein